MNVYIRQNELQNAYIGEYQEWWQPWANTVAYYPLKSDFNDASWNGYNLYNSWGSITTFNGIDCAYYSGNSSVYSENSSVPVWETRTINFRSYLPEDRYDIVVFTWQWTYGRVWVGYTVDNSICVWAMTDFEVYWMSWNTPIWWKWVNIVWVVEWYNVYLYINWELDTSGTRSVKSSSTTRLRVWGTGGNEWFKGYVNEVIFEDKARTAQEIADYYNQTKSDYGL